MNIDCNVLDEVVALFFLILGNESAGRRSASSMTQRLASVPRLFSISPSDIPNLC
jgi:hypothetical protein